ncbi:MAG: sigma factor [Prosthecobacter sp.]
MLSPTVSQPTPHGLFPPTSHTLLADIHVPDQKTREVSLARFCTLYYPAIYGFGRKLGLTVEDAQDRTQDFFMEIVRDGLLKRFDAERGTRFSTWLMRCFKNLELNHRAAKAAVKRGGGRTFVEFDAETVEHSYQSVYGTDLPLGPAFDLLLARGLWEMTCAQLRSKHESIAALIHDLLPLLLTERWPAAPAPSQEEMAAKHGTTTPRLKAFYNRTLKTQARRFFAQTAAHASPGISDAEIQDLWSLLCLYGDG